MIETFHTSSSEWSRDPTMRMYTPMLASDLVSLYTIAQYIEQVEPRVPRSFAQSATSSPPFFFGSHPIQYIQIAGRAIAPVQRSTFPQCTFELHDGFSEQRCGCVFTEPAPVEEGQLICVLGEVSYFHEPQVRVHQINWYRDSLAHEFMFKQEALDIRRFVLEQPVDELKKHSQLWMQVKGRPVLTQFIRDMKELPPSFLRVRKSLETKAKAWGFMTMREHAATSTRAMHDPVRARGSAT